MIKEKVITCIAVDDEKNALDVLQHHIQQTPYLELVQTFRDPLKALQWLSSNTADVIFLDINMPSLDGIQLKKILPEIQQVIFTTAYSEYALEGYELNVVDYLLKPIEFNRFLKAVQRLQQMTTDAGETIARNANGEPKSVFIKSGSEFHRLYFDQILYIESDGNYVTYHTTERQIICRSKLSDVVDGLPQNQFLRVHRSYAVAIAAVETFKSYELKIGNKYIPIGSRYRDEVAEKLLGNDLL